MKIIILNQSTTHSVLANFTMQWISGNESAIQLLSQSVSHLQSQGKGSSHNLCGNYSKIMYRSPSTYNVQIQEIL